MQEEIRDHIDADTLHFLSLDTVHHSYGPRTLAATSAIAFLDSCVEKVVAVVHEIGMDSRTTFLVVADLVRYAKTAGIRVGPNVTRLDVEEAEKSLALFEEIAAHLQGAAHALHPRLP